MYIYFVKSCVLCIWHSPIVIGKWCALPMYAAESGSEQNITRDKYIQSGNPQAGRAKGSRGRIARRFMADLNIYICLVRDALGAGEYNTVKTCFGRKAKNEHNDDYVPPAKAYFCSLGVESNMFIQCGGVSDGTRKTCKQFDTDFYLYSFHIIIIKGRNLLGVLTLFCETRVSQNYIYFATNTI